MKLNNIAFDLDGTLVDFMAVVKTVARDMGYEMIDNGKFQVETCPHLDDSDIWKIFNRAYDLHKHVQPYHGAVELLAKIYEATGQPVKIITARPHRVASQTYALTHRLFKTPHELVLVGSMREKITHLHGIDCYVDDRRKTVLELSKAGKGVFMPKRPYNHIESVDLPDQCIWVVGCLCELIPYVPSFVKEVC